MKYLCGTVMLFLMICIKISGQVPAERIPAFTFYKIDKTAFTNKDLQKGRLLFFVFFDTECEHCQHAIGYLSAHNTEFKRTVIYLLSLDAPDKIKAFMEKYGKSLENKKNVHFLRDVNNEFITRFKPKKYPSMFLYSVQKKLLMYDDDERNLDKFLREME